MPRSLQAWYSHDDLETLADRGTVLSGEFEVSKLTRLEGLVRGDAIVAATLACERATGGRLSLKLDFQATLSITCQRCLEPLDWPLDEQLEWLVVDSDLQPASVIDDEESLVLEQGRLCVDELLEDELIVALPMVPRHESVAECGPLAQNLEAALLSGAAGKTVELGEV